MPLSVLLKDEVTILWLKLNERRLIRECQGKERKRIVHPAKVRLTMIEKDKQAWLSNLRILVLDSDDTNALFSGNLTEFLKNLKLLSLSRSSLQSLSGVANMRKLKILAAEDNHLRSFNEVACDLLPLEYLYLSHNDISVPMAQSDINNLFAIREIDLSYNKLELLPGELLLLPSLEILNVSHNNLHVLSLSRMRRRPLTKRLHFLDLSYNKLVVFPEKLVEVAVKLDISHNRLRKLSELAMAKISSVWHSVQGHEDLKFEIYFDKNPLLVPPLLVALGGVTEITKYFFKLNIGLEEFFGTKIICFGEVGCGKTSLLLSLSSGHRRVTDSSQEKTEFSEIHCITHEISRRRLEKYSNIMPKAKSSDTMFLPLVSFNILAWDFSGNAYYEGLTSFFTTSSLISVICVNLQSYKDAITSYSLNSALSAASFYTCVGQWIDLLLSRTNGVTAIIVATKCDLVERTLIPGLVAQLQKDVHMYISYRIMKITDEIQRLEEMPRITATTKHQLGYLYNIYKSFSIAIHPEIVITSCVGSAEFLSELTTLCDAILKLTETLRDVFPFILHVIPPGWIKVAHFFEESSQNEPTAVETNNIRLLTDFVNFKRILHHRFQIKPDSALSIATYLHESGKGFLLRTAYNKDEIAALRTLIPVHQACHTDSFITSLESLVESLEYLLTPDLSYLLSNTTSKLDGLTFKQKIFRQKLKRSIAFSGGAQHIRKLFESTSHALETGCIPGSMLLHIFEACGLASALSGFPTIRSMFLIIWQWLEIGYPIKNYDGAVSVKPERLSVEDCLSNVSQYAKTHCRFCEDKVNAVFLSRHLSVFQYATPYSLAVAADILRSQEDMDEYITESLTQNRDPKTSLHAVVKPDWLASNGLPGLCFPMRLTASRSLETEQIWASAADGIASSICLAYRFPNGLTPGVLSRALVRMHWPEYVKVMHTVLPSRIKQCSWLDSNGRSSHILRFEMRTQASFH
ncbi:unnamed protein product [Schistocephalus solidus]|uniref:Malignant fibrous histiocytoma-amplified sequence 1 homolog n=1 Tax=Schistocephalus solidus TaxID=70667 RepID=A0A183TCK2_SCHSO|nr:unnamed protein product [Schistocephalus solidus]